MKSPLNIEIQRIKPRNDFKSFMKNIKKQLESVHHLCANGPRFKQTTNPRLNYSPSVPPPPPSLLNNQLSFPRQSEWRKKLPRRSSRMHRLRTIVLTRKYVLSSLSCCQYRFLFADLPKVDVVSRFIPFIADNFVRLASPATVSKPNDQFESAVYHIRGGRGGRREEEAQFNRGNRAIFPAIVPSSPLHLLLPSAIENPRPIDRSNRERGRVIFASTWCNFHEIHHRISRFICVVPRFSDRLLIGFYFVKFFFLRRGWEGRGGENFVS